MANNNIDNKIDKIFERVDSLCHQNKFEILDQELSSLNVSNLEAEEIVTYLMGTNPARDKLPNRILLFFKAQQELVKRKGHEETKRILRYIKV